MNAPCEPPAGLPGGDEVAEAILCSLRRIIRRVAEHSRHLARTGGLTVPQLLCLRAIASAPEGEEVSAARVSATVQLSPATVSRILDRLEQAGHLARERRSTDRRKVCLSLTASGREKLSRMPTPLQERFVARLARLDPPARRRLLESLEAIVTMMEAADLEAAPLLSPEADPGRGVVESAEDSSGSPA